MADEELGARVTKLEQMLGLQRISAGDAEAGVAGNSGVSDHCGDSTVSNHCLEAQALERPVS